MSVVILDSGGANIASLQHALGRLGTESYLSQDPARISQATHVVLPGVGAAGDAMQRLRSGPLAELIPQLRQPVLGICLGMQLLFEFSDEQDTLCLGALPGRAQRLVAAADRPVPHMGWNQLQVAREHPLLAGVPSGSWAYFVHSYALPPGADTLAICDYGVALSAVVSRDNFFGTQFHPERSAGTGARILANFLAAPRWN